MSDVLVFAIDTIRAGMIILDVEIRVSANSDIEEKSWRSFDIDDQDVPTTQSQPQPIVVFCTRNPPLRRTPKRQLSIHVSQLEVRW